MDLSCPVCYAEDKDGKWYQCDQGHPVCAECYWDDVDHPRHDGRRPTCVLCRDVLKRGPPVKCLERMQAIAAKKAAAATEEAAVKRAVEIALQDHEELELATALSVAQAEEEADAAKAVAQALQWSCKQAEQDRAEKRDQERAGLAAAQKLANASGGYDEQARVMAEYEAMYKQTKYTEKLQRQIAAAPDRVSTCCAIVAGLLEQLTPQERVLASAAIAQSAASSSSSLLSPDDVAQMKVPELKRRRKERGPDPRA